MHRTFPLAVYLMPALLSFSTLRAASLSTYTADANTLALYHFDEAAGGSDPGNPFTNLGTGGSSLDFTNTGGPDGRDNTGGGGYGAASFSGCGSAFDVLASGDNTYHLTAAANGGGLITTGTVLQGALQGASGSFTYEAIVRLGATANEQTIVAHDGALTRGFLFRVITGKLSLYDGVGFAEATIPTAGEHAFAANQWFHLAVTYSGAEGVADNVKFYWTGLNSTATQANLIGTGTLSTDLASATNNSFGVGTTTRNQYRFENSGLIDEVRISSVARGAGEFIFVPEPSTAIFLSAGTAMIALARRRKV